MTKKGKAGRDEGVKSLISRFALTMNALLWRADSKADAVSRFSAFSFCTVGMQSAHSFDLDTCKCGASESNTSSPKQPPSVFFPLPASLSAPGKLNLPSCQRSIWGRPLPKWAKGTLLSLLSFPL